MLLSGMFQTLKVRGSYCLYLNKKSGNKLIHIENLIKITILHYTHKKTKTQTLYELLPQFLSTQFYIIILIKLNI